MVALIARLLLDRVAILDKVGLEPNDWLYSVLAAGLIKVDGPVHHTVIGEAKGGLIELCCSRRHRLNLAGTIEQGVLTVGVQVGGGEGAHCDCRSCQAGQMAPTPHSRPFTLSAQVIAKKGRSTAAADPSAAPRRGPDLGCNRILFSLGRILGSAVAAIKPPGRGKDLISATCSA